jgi:hypothetical protein
MLRRGLARPNFDVQSRSDKEAILARFVAQTQRLTTTELVHFAIFFS